MTLLHVFSFPRRFLSCPRTTTLFSTSKLHYDTPRAALIVCYLDADPQPSTIMSEDLPTLVISMRDETNLIPAPLLPGLA